MARPPDAERNAPARVGRPGLTEPTAYNEGSNVTYADGHTKWMKDSNMLQIKPWQLQ